MGQRELSGRRTISKAAQSTQGGNCCNDLPDIHVITRRQLDHNLEKFDLTQASLPEMDAGPATAGQRAGSIDPQKAKQPGPFRSPAA